MNKIMTTQDNITKKATQFASMIIGYIAMGKMKTYEFHHFTMNDAKVTFWVEVAEWKGKTRYYVDADYTTYPRAKKVEEALSDNVYQTACNFINETNIALCNYTF